MTDFFDSWRSGGTGRGAYILTPRSNTEVPLSIDGLSTSGASDTLFRIRNSTGTVLFSVDNSGNISFAGSGVITVDQTVTGNLTVQGNTILGNSTSQDTLTVNAAATFSGTTTLSGGVSGNTTFSGLLSANNGLTVSGAANFNGQSTFNGNSDFTSDVTISNGANLILTGGTSSGKSLIRFQSAASNAYDTNLLHISSTTMTMGMIAGSTPTYAAANGPFIGLRGNTYSAVLTQRGNLFFGAGNPSTPATGEGEIRFTTGADVQRMVIDKGGVVYIPTPSTNRFVVGGTAALGGAGGSVATIIGNTTGVGVLALQNTTAANAGYAQLDLYNSSGTNVAGFGYGNTATIAATQDRTYFYTVAKDFHISTDSNTTRHFVVAATNGRALFTNTIIGGTIGVSAQITGSGSVASVLAAGKFSLLAGYTGASGSFGVYAQNQSAGTSTDMFGTVQAANYGEYIATTTGHIVGQAGYASGGATSYGGFFRAIVDKAGGVNIGIAGFGLNTTGTQIGGYFSLANTNPTYTSAALIADNGATTSPIFLARDNGTTVFSVSDGGVTALSTVATAGGTAGFTYTPGAHTAVTANVTDFKVAAHTMTITGGYSSQVFSHFATPTVTAASSLTLTYATNVAIEMASVTGSAVITNNTALVLGLAATAVTVNNAAGTHLSLFETAPQTFTLGATTQITNAIGVAGATFGAMTVNQSGGAVTVDNVATVYIAGALTAGASVTLTNNYAIFSDDGLNRFDGNGTHVFELPADATDPTGGGGAAAGRIAVKIGGATKYLAYY